LENQISLTNKMTNPEFSLKKYKWILKTQV
jgi:hypothetical protein